MSNFRTEPAEGSGELVLEDVSQSITAVPLMADDVFLAESFDSNHGVRHEKNVEMRIANQIRDSQFPII